MDDAVDTLLKNGRNCKELTSARRGRDGEGLSLSMLWLSYGHVALQFEEQASMASLVTSPRLLLCSAPAGGEDTRAVLEKAGWQVETRTAAQLEPEQARSFDLLVLDGGVADQDIWRACRSCRASLNDCFVPILATTSEPNIRMISLEAGADACFVRPFDPGELQARAHAFLRLRSCTIASANAPANFIAPTESALAYQQVDQNWS